MDEYSKDITIEEIEKLRSVFQNTFKRLFIVEMY